MGLLELNKQGFLTIQLTKEVMERHQVKSNN